MKTNLVVGPCKIIRRFFGRCLRMYQKQLSARLPALARHVNFYSPYKSFPL